MSPRFRLSAVPRARRARRDAAKGRVMSARAEAGAAARRAEDKNAELQGRMIEPAPSDAAAFVAAMAARRALAGELALRRQQAEEASRRVTASVDTWSAASQRRRMVEKLAERHQAAARKAELDADQRTVDDLSPGSRTAGGKDGR
ncbi:hypothetical protein GCM10010466_46180 [Planomonospora alba]|uniref:Flagellar FliJ protein n=1 Tax=Planomonospora alba TaxID=161354 RepID=A0ABP6NJ30_9ACTN